MCANSLLLSVRTNDFNDFSTQITKTQRLQLYMLAAAAAAVVTAIFRVIQITIRAIATLLPPTIIIVTILAGECVSVYIEKLE